MILFALAGEVYLYHGYENNIKYICCRFAAS